MRYRKSHLIEATYFIQDQKYKINGEYKTNSHGKRIIGMGIDLNLGGKININSYQEAKAVQKMLAKLLQQTRGKWYYAKKKPQPSKEDNQSEEIEQTVKSS